MRNPGFARRADNPASTLRRVNMKNFSIRHGLCTVLFLFASMLVTGTINAQTSNFSVYGVTTTNNLVRFNSARANTILSTLPITGLQGGENILGIDFRPATGLLFGLGSSSRIYRIDTSTAVATQVGTAGAFTLSGTNFGFDFNPVPDRIRVTSDLDQNLRLNPNDGTLTATDGTIAYAAGDPNAAQNPNIVASGYINSFSGATATTLYNLDSNLDILTTQNPPNAGTLNTVGALGVNITGEAGFDIAPGNNTALAALQITGATSSSLYRINLVTGAATLIGPIGGPLIRDIAIARSTASASANVDFDGDGRTDKSVFRIANSTWYALRSSDLGFIQQQWGLPGDTITPGDYDGDSKTDLAVWRETNGTFYVIASSDNTIRTQQWGLPGDEPVARDFDGDGTTDLGVVRRSGGLMTWYIANFSKSMIRVVQFGFDTDIVAPGDYDGDGSFDIAVRRGTGSELAKFYLLQSSAGYAEVQWGFGSDLVTPGDYDGDGKTDFTAVRAGTVYTWYILGSSNFSLITQELGEKPDLTTQGDYDGDGKTDVSVWNQSGGIFRWRRSTNGVLVSEAFGLNGDMPVANYDTH
ncbi:MAG: DUF4394 domain-containing protein [Saprospiraceae bacterium]|nr:DUF4394 domain-containing protein [Pyrinomonadaceae bacterium]